VLEAISVKSSSQDRSTESTSEMEREKEKRELYLVNNFHESVRGDRMCVIWLCLFCIRV